MKRVITKIGDIFAVSIDEKTTKYFQYVANDLSQLNSDVIRVFRQAYVAGATPDFGALVDSEVVFYAHCIVNWGVKLGFWEKVGSFPKVGVVDVLFRDSNDYGSPEIKISYDWWVWKINEERQHVGRLEGENRRAEIGVVINPKSIVHRIKTGKYDLIYPGYE